MTHKFNLLSGPECEITELTGKQQRILSTNGSKKVGDNLIQMLVSVVVRIGSVTDITEEIIRDLLIADRSKILVELRGFSSEWETEFEFDWEYTSLKGDKAKEPMILDLSKKFPELPYNVLNEDGSITQMKFNEYKEVPRMMEFDLPKSGKRVRMSYFSSTAEGFVMEKKDNQKHANTLLEARGPQYKAENGTWYVLELDGVGFKDMQKIRNMVKELEGAVDTIIIFDHPEASLLPQNKKTVKLDVLSEMAFFFPSQAM